MSLGRACDSLGEEHRDSEFLAEDLSNCANQSTYTQIVSVHSSANESILPIADNALGG